MKICPLEEALIHADKLKNRRRARYDETNKLMAAFRYLYEHT